MSSYTEQYYESHDGLRLYYRRYGDPGARVPLLCLPGLTRNSRDFEDLAAHLANRRQGVTPDFRGRGLSERDPNWRNYHPQTYVDDVVSLLDALNLTKVAIIGTSLGGLVATLLAEQHPERVAGVVLNDIGPEIAPEGLARITTYTGRMPPVRSWDEAVAQAKEIYGLAWRDLSEATWRRLARRGYREDENGVPRLDMDPKIGDTARQVGVKFADPWSAFSALETIPTVVLHGVFSDILTDDIVARMQLRKPDLAHVRVANRGHVPLLDEPECIEAIDAFLASLR